LLSIQGYWQLRHIDFDDALMKFQRRGIDGGAASGGFVMKLRFGT
jgi:predicted rRNA methylase YqxC with S4 and FtsJ domains